MHFPNGGDGTAGGWYRHFPESVSYTHLDVYKRQAPDSGAEVGVLGESKGPGTGDTAPIAGWTFVIAGAILTLALTAKKRKKEDK